MDRAPLQGSEGPLPGTTRTPDVNIPHHYTVGPFFPFVMTILLIAGLSQDSHLRKASSFHHNRPRNYPSLLQRFPLGQDLLQPRSLIVLSSSTGENNINIPALTPRIVAETQHSKHLFSTIA